MLRTENHRPAPLLPARSIGARSGRASPAGSVRARAAVAALKLWGRLAAEPGQTSAEYALVLFGAASVAMLVALWARSTDQVGKLLDAVFGNLVKMVR